MAAACLASASLSFAATDSGDERAPDLPIIAITDIQASVDSGRWADYKNSKAANFQNMLETQLVKVGRFKIIERNRVDEVLSEQALQGEFSGTNTVLAVGAVDYIVYGAVTKFGTIDKALSTRRFHATSRITDFGIDIKIVDALNGEIRKAENVEVSVTSGNATETRGLSVGAGAADPLADVQREAAKKVAAAVAESIFPIEVVAFQEDASLACCAYLNYGEAVLTLGDRLKVIEQSAPLVDGTTGLNLGAVETTIGVIEVIEVLEKFSKARSVSGESRAKARSRAFCPPRRCVDPLRTISGNAWAGGSDRDDDDQRVPAA